MALLLLFFHTIDAVPSFYWWLFCKLQISPLVYATLRSMFIGWSSYAAILVGRVFIGVPKTIICINHTVCHFFFISFWYSHFNIFAKTMSTIIRFMLMFRVYCILYIVYCIVIHNLQKATWYSDLYYGTIKIYEIVVH